MNYTLMNTEMTKAILDGRKVQTRRVMLDCDTFDVTCEDGLYNLVHNYKMSIENVGLFSTKEKLFKWFSDKYAKYQIGETIWVREPASIEKHFSDEDETETYTYAKYTSDNQLTIIENIDKRHTSKKWFKNRQGIPNGCIKEMARIFLKITDVRVERLQDITLEDIGKEGSPMDVVRAEEIGEPDFCYEWWIDLWDETAPKGYKWEDNPYVFVYEFKRVQND